MKRWTKRFRNKTAVVTGGASGIGRALCERLADCGAKVVVADLDEVGATKVAKSIDGFAEQLDVTDAEAFQRVIASACENTGRLDFLFNNAGIGLAGEVRDAKLADWKRVIDVNLWGVVHGVDAAYPVMVEQGCGHIVNTASGAGLLPRPGMTPYAAAKHAVVGLSTSLRAEGAGLGVSVSAVCPGYIKTAIMDSTKYVGVDKDRLASAIPIAPISAEDCAEAILKGVAKNRAIILVSKLVSFEWALFRLSPRLGVKLSTIRGSQFRKHRADPG